MEKKNNSSIISSQGMSFTLAKHHAQSTELQVRFKKMRLGKARRRYAHFSRLAERK